MDDGRTQLRDRMLRDAIVEVLRGSFDAFGNGAVLSVVDAGLLGHVTVEGDRVRVELALPPKWSPFADSLATEVQRRVHTLPEVTRAEITVIAGQQPRRTVMYDTERVLRAAVQALTTGDLEALPTYFADDVVVHVPGTNRLAGDYKGKSELFDGFLGTLMTLTDGQVVLQPHDIVGGEDHAVGIYTWRATRDARTFEWRHVNVYHITDGKIVEAWQHPFDFQAWNEFWS